ncbi:MAG: NAD(P)/FAD-dependent oxidoreductase [Prevotella sp.]|nr:NAD(P)/FAD-dependent oxidoreductase [Prevotella sp.]
MMNHTLEPDLLIIGAGPGGYRAAEYAAKQGLQVVIAEQGEVGGTCLNRGCIPTKTYVHSATFAEAFERQQAVVQQLRAGVEGILTHPNITLVRGHVSFVDARTVRVGGDTVAAEQTMDAEPTVAAKNIIIATGSKAKMPPALEAEADPRVVTSTELLQLSTLPRKLCIIGAGVIGMEFASVFHRFGSEVTVIEFLKECLPTVDSDVAKRLRKLLEKRGITFRMKTAVQSLADIDADVILIATGRQANTEGLNLEAAGITPDARGFITVDEHFRCGHIYAIGDVNGRQMLAHAAEMQAVSVVNHMLGRQDNIRFDVMPAAIFTEPEAACVGLSEDQLKAAGIAYRCGKAFHRANGKALAMGETEGLVKLFWREDDGLLTGCHAFGAHAADIVQEVSVLMCRDTTVSQLRDMVHIHPTLGELLLDAANAAH